MSKFFFAQVINPATGEVLRERSRPLSSGEVGIWLLGETNDIPATGQTIVVFPLRVLEVFDSQQERNALVNGEYGLYYQASDETFWTLGAEGWNANTPVAPTITTTPPVVSPSLTARVHPLNSVQPAWGFVTLLMYIPARVQEQTPFNIDEMTVELSLESCTPSDNLLYIVAKDADFDDVWVQALHFYYPSANPGKINGDLTLNPTTSVLQDGTGVFTGQTVTWIQEPKTSVNITFTQAALDALDNVDGLGKAFSTILYTGDNNTNQGEYVATEKKGLYKAAWQITPFTGTGKIDFGMARGQNGTYAFNHSLQFVNNAQYITLTVDFNGSDFVVGENGT